MTTYRQLRGTIADWVDSVSPDSYEVLISNTGEGPRPSGNYIMVFLMEGESPGVQVNRLSEDGNTETISAYVPFTCTLDIFGGDALQVGSKIERSLKSAQRHLDLWTVCGISNINPKKDLTHTVAAARKQRCMITLKLNSQLSDTFDASGIETVDMTINASNDSFDIEAEYPTD